MDTRVAIKKRQSVRQYQRLKISDEILIDLIDCARMAPSGRSEHPFEFIVIREKTNLIKLYELVRKNACFLKDADACIVVFCRPSKYYLEDGSAATQNILLAATSFGIGSCWIAGDKKEYAEDVKNLLGIPGEYKLVSLVSLGYPAENLSESRKKRPLAEVLHWEKFQIK